MKYSSEHFIKILSQTLGGSALLKLPGDVFLSSWATMKPGPLYILGFNPGGSAEECCSIEDSLHSTDKASTGYSAYVDEIWPPSREAGAHKHQRRVKEYLKKSLGWKPQDTPASNVLFVTKETIDKAKDLAEKYLATCWAVHEEALKIIQPKVILCLGNAEQARKSAYACLRDRENTLAKKRVVVPEAAGQVKWFYSDHLGKSRILVIGVRHPSRSDPSPETLEKVASLYKEVCAN